MNVLNKIKFDYKFGILHSLLFGFFSMIMVLLNSQTLYLGIVITTLSFIIGGIQIKQKGEL